MLALLLGIGLTGCGDKEDTAENQPTAEPSDTAPNDAPLYGEPAIDEDGDGFMQGQDCNDQDANTFPGAAEIESTTECMTDVDQDGYGDANVASPITAGDDCNDNDAMINPGMEEVADDSVDNNCDGEVDEFVGDLYGVPE